MEHAADRMQPALGCWRATVDAVDVHALVAGRRLYLRGSKMFAPSSNNMGNVVSNTADILAILGGVTTLVLGLFGAIRLSRCQTVKCCWGCINLVNKPIAAGAAVAVKPAQKGDTPPTPTTLRNNSEMDLSLSAV